MATVYRCDRCGKETHSKPGNMTTVTLPFIETWREDSGKSYDLCLTCLTALHKTAEPLPKVKASNDNS